MLLRVLQELSAPSSPACTSDEGPSDTMLGAQEVASTGDDEQAQVAASGEGDKEMHVEVASMRITVVNDCAGYNEPFVVLCLQRLNGMHLARRANLAPNLAPYPPASACQEEEDQGMYQGMFESCSVVAARIQVMWCFC